MGVFDLDGVFDEDDYLHFYFHDEESSEVESDLEASQVARLLELRPGMRVLDAPCGHGRIAQRLAARGLRVVGIERAPHFVRLARRNTQTAGVEVEYRVGDLRELELTAEFDAALNWFTGFGYFDDATDRDILRRYHRALKPGGRLLLELQNRDRLLRFFNPGSGHALEVGEDLMLDHHTFDPISGRTTTSRFIWRAGRMRRTEFSVRVFAFTEIRDWLLDAGFSDVRGVDREGAYLTIESRRMAVIATA
jgi:SAM-dependent methyltransferase